MVFSSTLIGGIIGFSGTILLSRILGPENFGLFKTITALYGTIITLFDFGLQNTLTKYTSEFSAKGQNEKIKFLIQNIFLFRLIVLIFIVALSVALKEQIAITFLKDKKYTYLMLPGIIFAILSFIDITRPIIIGLQNFKLLSVVNILVPVLNIVILIPLTIFFGLPLAIIAAGFSYILGSTFSIIYIFNQNIFKKTSKSIFVFPKLIFSYGLPSYFSNLPAYLFLGIIPIISLLFGQLKVGFYSFAFSFFSVTMIFPFVISQIIFPKIAGKPSSAFIILKRSLYFYSLIAMIEITFTFFLIKPIILLIAPQFMRSANLVIALITSGAILGSGILFITYFTALHKLRIAFFLNTALGFSFIAISLLATKVLL